LSSSTTMSDGSERNIRKSVISPDRRLWRTSACVP
jgi:hypothetical protein